MEDRRWYVCQTYSGYENSVKINLERRIESMQMEDCIFQIMIPEEIRIEKRQQILERVKSQNQFHQRFEENIHFLVQTILLSKFYIH